MKLSLTTSGLLDPKVSSTCLVIEDRNRYRFRHSSATAKSRIKAREQSKRGKAGGKAEPF